MAATIFKSFFLLFFVFLSTCALNNSSSPHNASLQESHLRSLCKSTPHPDACFDSLKLTISISILPNILNLILQSLKTALSEGEKVSTLLSTAGPTNLIEKQKGTIQDCQELHEITQSSLTKSMSYVGSSDSRKLSDSRVFLSAALTNHITCLEGLDLAYGPLKPSLINSLTTTYKYVSNSLSFLSKPSSSTSRKNRRLLGVPRWLSRKSRRILQTSSDQNDPAKVLTVAADGTGNFTTINEAINFAPNKSVDRIFIYIRKGVYRENVLIPKRKPNIVFLGDGVDATVISSKRSVGDGWTTFRSATVAVAGEGFLARDITFENSAGPTKGQAVALRVSADFSAIYKCSIKGYQDTLYVHSFRQFYRECNISGTIDYIFGNAAVVFQECNIISRMPSPGHITVITAQSRQTPDEVTGISIQNCSILAADELLSNMGRFKNFLGRPWKSYSRTVYLESYIDDFIAPEGWSEMRGDEGLDTLYYGEYENYGPGSSTDNRVSWPGYHLMDYDDASEFTVSMFIAKEEWLDSTSFPYYDGV